MKNRMNVPETYEPVLPQKVKSFTDKKKEQASTDTLLTQTATAIGKVIGQLLTSHHKFAFMDDRFNVQDLTTEQFQELKTACVNHLTHLIPGIEKESIE